MPRPRSKPICPICRFRRTCTQELRVSSASHSGSDVLMRETLSPLFPSRVYFMAVVVAIEDVDSAVCGSVAESLRGDAGLCSHIYTGSAEFETADLRASDVQLGRPVYSLSPCQSIAKAIGIYPAIKRLFKKTSKSGCLEYSDRRERRDSGHELSKNRSPPAIGVAV
jgi:hypothetical protein